MNCEVVVHIAFRAAKSKLVEKPQYEHDWNGREIWTEGHREALAGRCIVSSEAQDTELAG